MAKIRSANAVMALGAAISLGGCDPNFVEMEIAPTSVEAPPSVKRGVPFALKLWVHTPDGCPNLAGGRTSTFDAERLVNVWARIKKPAPATFLNVLSGRHYDIGCPLMPQRLEGSAQIVLGNLGRYRVANGATTYLDIEVVE